MPVNLSIKDVPDDLAERLRQRAQRHHRSLQGELMAIVEQAASGVAPAPASRKLGYKDQRELDALPARIDALEAEQRELAELLAGSEIYQRDNAARLAQVQERYARIEDELMAALERWEALGSV